MRKYQFGFQHTPPIARQIHTWTDDDQAVRAAEALSKLHGCPVMVTKNPWRGQPGRLVKIVGAR